MKKLMVILTSLISLNLFAVEDKINCSLNGFVDGSISINLVDLETSKPKLSTGLEFSDYEGNEISFSFNEDGAADIWRMLYHPEANQLTVNSKGDITFAMYSEECGDGRLHLYKNSSFKYGYLSLDESCPDIRTDKKYTKLNCKVTKVK